MDTKRINELIRIFENSNLEELEITDKGTSVRLVRQRQSTAPPSPSRPATSADQAVEASREKKEDGYEVKSPMVGTFYRAATPDAGPFVKEGDRVQQGDVLCIIEAMKTMNKIKCDRAGRIRSVQVENAMPVEFGQTLFIIA